MDDLWTGKREASRRKAICKIYVNGVPVNDAIDPHLLTVTIIDRFGGVDSCSVELDDREGRLQIPGFNGNLHVELGWHSEQMARVFNGYIDSIESGGSRKHGGRRLWIEAKTGVGSMTDGKTPMQMSFGDGAPPGEKEGVPLSFSQVFSEAAGKAGYTGVVGGGLGDVKRDYWSMQTESFHHWANRHAEELGGVFKVSGNTATIVPRMVPTGPGIHAIWGDNLLEWRIRPYMSQNDYAKTQQHFFDTFASSFQKVAGSVGHPEGGFSNGGQATAQPMALAPNKSVGGQQNSGNEAASQANVGTGWVSINGEPQARGGSDVTIEGARRGVDGIYLIDEAQHHYLRGGGYTCLLKVLPRIVTTGTGTGAPNIIVRSTSTGQQSGG